MYVFTHVRTKGVFMQRKFLCLKEFENITNVTHSTVIQSKSENWKFISPASVTFENVENFFETCRAREQDVPVFFHKRDNLTVDRYRSTTRT